jgi:hypothetical protein
MVNSKMSTTFDVIINKYTKNMELEGKYYYFTSYIVDIYEYD